VTTRPSIQEIHTYLLDNGWQRRPQTWNGASIWSNANGYEVLVPAHDELADTELRVSEILTTLATVERRTSDEIAGDINTPFNDIQLYRTFPDGMSDGFMSLTAGLRELRSARDMISAAARAVIEGPLPVFSSGIPAPVGELLQQIRLGPSHPEKHVFTVRVPFNGQSAAAVPFARQVVSKLHAAVAAVHSVTAHATESELSAFDRAVSAGASANLCEALSGLAGRQYRQPFEVTFRWGRGLPSDIPAETIHFADGVGSIIRAAAMHLRQIGASGVSVITGFVESLHGQPLNEDYWLIKVRGSLNTQGSNETERTVWVRLDRLTAYDRAIAAHRTHLQVRASGERSAARGHIELIVNDEGLLVL
jgi:hypothetical protein